MTREGRAREGRAREGRGAERGGGRDAGYGGGRAGSRRGRIVICQRRKDHHHTRGLELELIQPHMAQKPVLRGEVGRACVAREVSVERGGMGERGCARRLGVIAIEIIAEILVEEISRKADAFCCLVHLKMNMNIKDMIIRERHMHVPFADLPFLSSCCR